MSEKKRFIVRANGYHLGSYDEYAAAYTAGLLFKRGQPESQVSILDRSSDIVTAIHFG